MRNIVRREPYTFCVRFDKDMEELATFTLRLWQRGRVVLCKGKDEAKLYTAERRADFLLTGEETVRFSPYDVTYAQVQMILADGTERYGPVEEVNIVDVLNGWGGRPGLGPSKPMDIKIPEHGNTDEKTDDGESSGGILWARYDRTSYEEIEAAYKAGKQVFLWRWKNVLEDWLYPLTEVKLIASIGWSSDGTLYPQNITGYQFFFAGIDGNTQCSYVCTPTGWRESSTKIGGANMGCVTPEQYGAVGDGVHDDGPALTAALKTGLPVVLTQDLYLFSENSIYDQNIYLDGQGYTLHCDGASHPAGTSGRFLCACVNRHDGIIDGADVVTYTDTSENANLNPAFPNTWYRRGYLSYHGFNPTSNREVYESYTAYSWKEYRADIKNVNFVCRNSDDFSCLCLMQTCNSTVDNCTFRTEDGHDARMGLEIIGAYNMRVTRCTAEGFLCAKERQRYSVGYGIYFYGDAITVDNCMVRNCKCGIVPGGNGDYLTTNALISNITYQDHDTGERAGNGSRTIQQCIDIHEGCDNPMLINIVADYFTDQPMDEENIPCPINISCPESTLINLRVKTWTKSIWVPGMITFGPLVRKVHFKNLYAPNMRLGPNSWGIESGTDSYAPSYLREIDIDGGEIYGIEGARGLVDIHLTGVKVNAFSQNVNRLYANNCVFRNESERQSVPTIAILQEAFFTNCDISATTKKDYSKSLAVVSAPPNSVHMHSCIIRRPLDRNTFGRKEQTDVQNCIVMDLWGLILGSQVTPRDGDPAKCVPNYVEGDACTLDEFNLW